jgi:hypothetical protein
MLAMPVKGISGCEISRARHGHPPHPHSRGSLALPNRLLVRNLRFDEFREKGQRFLPA